MVRRTTDPEWETIMDRVEQANYMNMPQPRL